MPSATGLLRVVSNSELDRQAEMERERQEAYEANNSPLLQGLAKHVTDRWVDAKSAKDQVLPRLKRAHRARMGEYDSQKLAQIREFGGSEEYARITANKCRVVESWLRDVFLGQTEKPWTLHPTPKPQFPPDELEEVRTQISREVAGYYAQTGQMPDPVAVRGSMSQYMDAVSERVREEARKTTRRMERHMEDQLALGGFLQATGEFLSDLTTYPAAIIKGPIVRRRNHLEWTHEGGDMAPSVEQTLAPEFERVDPFRFFPAPGASSPQEGYCFEYHTYSYSELYDLIGSPGYDEDAIRAVLRESSSGSLHNWVGLMESHVHDDAPDSIPYSLERKEFDIDVLEYHGPVKGSDLISWGMDEIEDPDATYEACVMLVGKWVIKAQLNYDPLGVRPYFHASYESLPGEFWGFGIPDILEDVQGIVNAAVRALVNNMGFASGPQIGINVDRLAPGEDLTNMHPLRIWQLVESQFGSKEDAIQFFQPDSNATELLQVIEHFYKFADDFSLVPRYMAGSEQATGAGRTASGLSMLMDAANKGLKGVVSNIDMGVIKPLLEKLYTHNMLYAEDTTIKGDAQVFARGAVSLMQKETLQLRRNEFLNITGNPLDTEIIGPSGRAEVLREVARDLELDVNRIVPPREVLDQMQVPQGGPGQQQAPMGSQESLENGAPVTDNMSPSGMV